MALCWHWRDPMEGMFPCGLSYSSGVLREAAHDFASLAKAYGSVKLVDNPPDVVVVLDEAPRMDARNRAKYLYRQWALDDVLLHWVVWNGGRETETFSRGGTSISVKPQYPGMIRERD